jgi:hypothetical protein
MTVALYRSGRVGIRRIGELLFPALVLAFGVVGWSHLYHAVVLGYADTPAGHTEHVLRDGLLAVPVALVAVLLALSAYYASVTGNAAWTIDPATVEDAVGRDLKEKLPGLRVGGVACPEGIKTVEGATFQCTAEVEGVQAPFSVTVTELDAGEGTFNTNWKPIKAILVIDQAVTYLKSRVQDQAPNATVDCGAAPVRVVEVGGAIECTISEGSDRLVVRGVVQDVEGTVRFEQQD